MKRLIAMLSRVLSGAVFGIDAYVVRVEADVANGLPNFSTVGLAQGAVREGKDRVIAAIKNSDFTLPPKRITINLAPADVRKDGSGFDLPIAVGILSSTGQVAEGRLGDYLLVGELGLDGSLRPIRGALPIAVAARSRGLKGVILPRGNVREAAVVDQIEVRGATSLREVTTFLDGKHELRGPGDDTRPTAEPGPDLHLDFADVRGQEHAKRALEVAAAGAHNILMTGSPGSGKTMLARRLPGILPPLSLDEALETTKIHSVAGLLTPDRPLVRERPFRAPHHTISDAGLIGGGSNPRPGEVSLAHNGVLFLDELPEFKRHVLEAMRQPLEDHQVRVARAGLTLCFPARYLFVAAMNPCPCGYYGAKARPCSCTPSVVQRYMSRVSGPLLDRIDIHIEVPPVPHERLAGSSEAEPSKRIRSRVEAARARQVDRFASSSGAGANAYMSARDLRRFCRLDSRGEALLRSAADRLRLSARAHYRILKLARTIGDLEGAAEVRAEHIAEAVQYRSRVNALG